MIKTILSFLQPSRQKVEAPTAEARQKLVETQSTLHTLLDDLLKAAPQQQRGRDAQSPYR